MKTKHTHIDILHPGIACSIQDCGRFGYLSEGIPISGAMNLKYAGLANFLVGNSKNEAVIEWKLAAPKLLFSTTTQIAIVANNVKLYINKQQVPTYKRITVQKNDVLEIKLKGISTYGYLAVLGGIQTPKILGSRSMYLNITPNPFLKKGMKLPIISKITDNCKASFSKLKPIQIQEKTIVLSLIKGPEFEWLPKKIQLKLCNYIFSIDSQSNRMGYLLNKNIEEHMHSMLSSPVLPGTIQWTPSGKLIILMRDAQTIGGYPRIAQLTESSISELSKATTKNFIQFSFKDKVL